MGLWGLYSESAEIAADMTSIIAGEHTQNITLTLAPLLRDSLYCRTDSRTNWELLGAAGSRFNTRSADQPGDWINLIKFPIQHLGDGWDVKQGLALLRARKLKQYHRDIRVSCMRREN